jgi:hypothetical protein
MAAIRILVCLTIWNQEYIIGSKARQSQAVLHVVEPVNCGSDQAAFSLSGDKLNLRISGGG